MQGVAANTAIQQFGRNVKVDLMLRCDNLYQDREKYKSDDFYQAFLFFSERISIGHVFVRYMFDGREPPEREHSEVGENGRIIFFFAMKTETNNFIDRLKRSSKLRVQLDLPWAGQHVIEFNTAGAPRAFDHVPCGLPNETKPHNGVTLGIRPLPLSPAEARAIGVAGGLRIIAVEEGPARAATLKPADILLSLGALPTTNYDEVRNILRALKSGDRREAIVFRDGQIIALQITF
jgi:hypothetical protein